MSLVSMKHAWSLVALALAALTGCSGGGGALEAQGKVTAASGKTAPDAAAVSVFWTVSSGSPDYGYAFGSGEATASGFDLSFDADPPAEALNSYGVGVGMLILLPEGQGLAQGKVSDQVMDTLDQKALGAAGEYAIIFKKAGSTQPAWISAFPDGYSCAKGVPAASGETFDTFAPVDCAEIVITVDDIDHIHFTNWT